MNQIDSIKEPILQEFSAFLQMYDDTLQSDNELLNQVLKFIANRKGKMMRPMLTLLVSKGLGGITDATLHAAVAVELLHCATLLHDDVVDESDKRRGQPSVNAAFNNKVSVLVGDFLLSAALQHAALTGNSQVVNTLAKAGKALADGEIRQLDGVQDPDFDEDDYFGVILNKTAALFDACATMGAITANADEDHVQMAGAMGEYIGMCFQIVDDIFDYYDDQSIGKPTGNDMREGKLTLPVLYALRYYHEEGDSSIDEKELSKIVVHVKALTATDEEIAQLVHFTLQSKGIALSEGVADSYKDKALDIADSHFKGVVQLSLKRYINFVAERDY